MDNFKSLLVVWKSKKNGLYYHVGTLNYDGEHYTYEYTYHSKSPRKIDEALDNGYFLHPFFPELKKKYKSETLFEAFDRRIPDQTRIDYRDVLLKLGLDLNVDRMDILKATRGIISGDSYSFEQPLQLKNNILKSQFYINGMRHREDLPDSWYDFISVGDELILKIEEDNPIDKYAVKIETKSGMFLGYVPGIYSQATTALLSRDVKIDLVINDIQPEMAPQWWVRVGFTSYVDIPEPEKFYLSALEGLIQELA